MRCRNVGGRSTKTIAVPARHSLMRCSGHVRQKPGVLGKMGFLAQKQMDVRADADLELVGIAVPASNRSVSQSPAVSARLSRSDDQWRGLAR